MLRDSGLVTDGTINKGTGKRHKTDENSTHFEEHTPKSLFGIR